MLDNGRIGTEHVMVFPIFWKWDGAKEPTVDITAGSEAEIARIGRTAGFCAFICRSSGGGSIEEEIDNGGRCMTEMMAESCIFR
nr:hypothetical protein Iba_chr15cCG5810 [Ipomoea batatas]